MVVTVLGTGLMGFGMAARMAADGLEVRAWNRTIAKAAPLAEHGVAVLENAAEAVDGADVVISMLFDVNAVAEVMQAVAPRVSDQAAWLQMSTVGPDGTARLADAAAQHGLRMLDAPVLGTKKPAADGTLVVLASGPAAVRDQAQPVLESIATKTIWAGDRLGAASELKLACNAWVLSVTAATGQSVALARGLGLDPQLFLDAIDGTATDCLYAHVKGGQMITGEYQTSFPIDGGLKDQALIAAAARSARVDPILIDAVGALNRTAADRGHGDDDLAAVYTGF